MVLIHHGFDVFVFSGLLVVFSGFEPFCGCSVVLVVLMGEIGLTKQVSLLNCSLATPRSLSFKRRTLGVHWPTPPAPKHPFQTADLLQSIPPFKPAAVVPFNQTRENSA